MEIENEKGLSFDVVTKYGRATYDKRFAWRNRDKCLESLPEEFVDSILATIPAKEFVGTSEVMHCSRGGRDVERSLPSYSSNLPERILDFDIERGHCRGTDYGGYYVGVSGYQTKIDGTIFYTWLDKEYPNLRKLFKVEFYGFTNFVEAYIKSYDKNDESLYVPIEALIKRNFKIAEDRMISYNKFSGYTDWENKLKKKPYAKVLKSIINGTKPAPTFLTKVRDIANEKNKLLIEEKTVKLREQLTKAETARKEAEEEIRKLKEELIQ